MKPSQEIDIHFQALCNAVEHEKLEKAKSILEQHPDLRLDGINADGFTPLDLAFMTGNAEILGMLLNHRLDECTDEEEFDDENEEESEEKENSLVEGRLQGRAIEGDVFPSPEAVSAHLRTLIEESKKQVEKFGQLIKAAANNQPVSVIATSLGTPTTSIPSSAAAASLTPAQLKECEKQQSLWHKRLVSLKKMLTGFDACGCPHAPSNVSASVTSQTSIQVKLNEPELVGPYSLFTKFKVQWSHYDSFSKISGERVVMCSSDEGQKLECLVGDLTEGQRYFVRASFGNPKGFGPFSAACPKSVVPSTWRSVDEKVSRIRNQMDLCVDVLDDLMSQYNSDETDLPEVSSFRGKRKGLLQLFSSGSNKFQKTVMPNRVHICCVLFHEDRVLMTNDDVLPMVVVDEAFPGGAVLSGNQLQQEYHWFSKLCHMWDDVSKLKREMSKVVGSNQRSLSNLSATSHLSFRLKVLQAVATLQNQLGGLSNDLGHAFWHPFVDQNSSGNRSVIFSAVRHVKHPKSLVNLSLKWVHLARALGSTSRLPGLTSNDFTEAMDHLRYSIRQQILFNQVCHISLNRGLFLCYLQARSTIEGGIEVAVCNTSPSIFPYVKLRDNPHVNSDEWSWIQRLASASGFKTSRSSHHANLIHAPSPTTNFLTTENEEGSEEPHSRPTEEQYAFGRMLEKGMERLFDSLEISHQDRYSHRLYQQEIIELADDVSVILVLPPPQSVCFLATSLTSDSGEGCSLNLRRSDLLLMPLTMFELINLATYHVELVVSYIRAMSFLDLDLTLAKQTHREALTNEEVESSQRNLSMREEQHRTLEESWRPMRWLREVINQARSRTGDSGLTYDMLTSWYSKQTDLPDDAAYFARNSASNDPTYFYQSASNGSSEYFSASYGSRRQSGAGQSLRQPLTRTPTTRSDPTDFKATQDDSYVRYYSVRGDGKITPENKENWGRGDQDLYKKKKLQAYDAELYVGTSSSGDIRKFSLQAHTSDQQLSKYYQKQMKPSGHSSDGVSLSGWKSSLETSKFEPNVLQVYAAYHSGLANGTSVKLNVTQATTAREVVDLVVKQLNMAVILKGKGGPIYESEELKNFCLVAVIGSRERCLRDDFRPLNLQNPWKSGKLFVRMKNDLLAAFERSGKDTTNSQDIATTTTTTTTIL